MKISCPKCKHKFTPKLSENERQCDFCGSPYVPIRKNQKYCDGACRRGFHNAKIMEMYHANKV